MVRDTTSETTKRLMAVTIVLAFGVVVAGTALVLLGGAFTVVEPAAAQVQVEEFAVPDHTEESAQVTDVQFEWYTAGNTVEWSGAPEPVDRVDVTIRATGPDGGMQDLHTHAFSPDSEAPERRFEPTTDGGIDSDVTVELLSNSDWTAADFTAEPGEEVSHTLDVEVVVMVAWDGGSTTETVSDTTTITVSNPTEPASTPNGTVQPIGNAETDVTVNLGSAEVSVLDKS